MKRAKVLLLAVASMFILSSATVFADGNVWWEGLTQDQRNFYIVNRAWQDNGTYVGKECKPWVTYVVKSASSHVDLPSTNPAPNDWYWADDYHYHAVGMSGGIESTQPGYIVQMHLTNGKPHTAIVISKDSAGVGFMESNWPYGTLTVNYRYVTFSVFKSQVTAYSVYYIR